MTSGGLSPGSRVSHDRPERATGRTRAPPPRHLPEFSSRRRPNSTATVRPSPTARAFRLALLYLLVLWVLAVLLPALVASGW